MAKRTDGDPEEREEIKPGDPAPEGTANPADMLERLEKGGSVNRSIGPQVGEVLVDALAEVQEGVTATQEERVPALQGLDLDEAGGEGWETFDAVSFEPGDGEATEGGVALDTLPDFDSIDPDTLSDWEMAPAEAERVEETLATLDFSLTNELDLTPHETPLRFIIKEYIDALFPGISEKGREVLINHPNTRIFLAKADHKLTERSSLSGHSLYVIASKDVKIHIDGREDLLEPSLGGVFGQVGWTGPDGGPRTTNANLATPSMLIEIPHEAFLELPIEDQMIFIEGHMSYGGDLMRELNEGFTGKERVIDVSTKIPDEALAGLAIGLSETFAQGDSVALGDGEVALFAGGLELRNSGDTTLATLTAATEGENIYGVAGETSPFRAADQELSAKMFVASKTLKLFRAVIKPEGEATPEQRLAAANFLLGLFNQKLAGMIKAVKDAAAQKAALEASAAPQEQTASTRTGRALQFDVSPAARKPEVVQAPQQRPGRLRSWIERLKERVS
jgi:hypothetical protein